MTQKSKNILTHLIDRLSCFNFCVGHTWVYIQNYLISTPCPSATLACSSLHHPPTPPPIISSVYFCVWILQTRPPVQTSPVRGNNQVDRGHHQQICQPNAALPRSSAKLCEILFYLQMEKYEICLVCQSVPGFTVSGHHHPTTHCGYQCFQKLHWHTELSLMPFFFCLSPLFFKESWFLAKNEQCCNNGI